MKTRALNVWEKLISSLWFLPAVMVVAGGGLAVLALYTGQLPGARDWLGERWIVYGDVETARRILSTIAGSMITVAGVVFSISVVALSVASSQFGPRVLRSFMRDRGNQIVFGAFIATFVYCVLVLGGIQDSGNERTTVYTSVGLGLLLTLVNLGVLIYFIHHISSSLQASEIAARIGNDLRDEILSLFPELPDSPPTPLPDSFERDAKALPSSCTGYLQAIASDELAELACKNDLRVRANYRPGHLIVAGGELLQVAPADRCDDRLAKRILNCFIIGAERTQEQDVEFSLQQLVQVALRALSPGINDPITGITCVDQITAGLCCAAERANPPSCICDNAGNPRLFLHPTRFSALVRAAFDPIRQAARHNAAVTIRLLECIELIAPFTHRPADRAELRRQSEMILRGSAELPEFNDRRDAEARYESSIRRLGPQIAAATRRA